MLSRVIVAAVATGGEVCKKAAKQCGVCHDVAKSYHFGGMSCDSCKAFFRRSVQNEAFRAFQCAFRSRCDITVVSRKCCQYCRFQKCLAIGMEIGWVMTEEERMNMLRNRMEKKRGRTGNGRNSDSGDDECDDAKSFQPRRKRRATPASVESSAGDDGEIEKLTLTFASLFKVKDDSGKDDVIDAQNNNNNNEGQPKWMLMLLFMISIQKLVRFARGSRHFCDLSLKDQMALLRANVFEMFLVVHFYQRNVQCLYPSCRCDDDDRKRKGALTSCPFLTSLEDGGSLGHLLYGLIEDTPTLVLFLMLILFCPDASVTSADAQTRQMHFCNLLDRHMAAILGVKSRVVFPKLLLILPTLREIRDKHLFYHFDIGHQDFHVIFNAL